MGDIMWSDIEGYENYIIYSNGEVFSKNRGKFLKKCIGSDGYYGVNLYKNGVVKTHKIHRLVATHFLETIENKNYVDHIDGDKLNNNVENLRFCNLQENGMNRSFNKNNKLEIKGICVDRNGYRARIEFNGKFHSKYFPLTDMGLVAAITWRSEKSLEICPQFHRV